VAALEDQDARGQIGVTDRLLTAEELHRPGQVYVLDVDARSAVKIGFTSKSASRRRKALQTGHPLPLRVVWDGPGTLLDEASIHRLLSPSRLEGEWFARTDIVRLAVSLMMVYGAQWVGEMEINQLETFVPHGRHALMGLPRWQRMRPLHEWGVGGFWPQWTKVP
jgi:hypothetical protein